MTTEQRIMMRLNALRIRPIVEATRIWARGNQAYKNTDALKEMRFTYDEERRAWWWKRPPKPVPMHRANPRRAKRFSHELTNPNS